MINRGGEQKAVEALSFTRTHIYLLNQQYTISIQTILGDEKEWSQVLAFIQITSMDRFKRICVRKTHLQKGGL